MSMKNSMTPAGIEPATFRFVAQHLKHCATAVPTVQGSETNPEAPNKKEKQEIHKRLKLQNSIK
jgi:hypothetical protein